MEAIEAEMANVARGTGAFGYEQKNATLALFGRLQNNPLDWTGSKDLMATVDNLDTFLSTVALMAEYQLAMNTEPDDVFVETQAALWLSTKAGDILEKIRKGGDGAKKIAEILRENQAAESERDLLLNFLARMNPSSKIDALSQLERRISNKRMDTLTKLLATAANLRKVFNDSRQAVLDQYHTAAMDSNWAQMRAFIKEEYEKYLLELGFALVSGVVTVTTTVAAVALWTLCKVALGTFRTKSKEEVDDVIAGGRIPNPDGKFYTKKTGGNRKFWAQMIGKEGTLRLCRNNGYQWTQRCQLIRREDPEYDSWQETER